MPLQQDKAAKDLQIGFALLAYSRSLQVSEANKPVLVVRICIVKQSVLQTCTSKQQPCSDTLFCHCSVPGRTVCLLHRPESVAGCQTQSAAEVQKQLRSLGSVTIFAVVQQAHQTLSS